MKWRSELKVLLKLGLVEKFLNEWGEVCYRTTAKGEKIKKEREL